MIPSTTNDIFLFTDSNNNPYKLQFENGSSITIDVGGNYAKPDTDFILNPADQKLSGGGGLDKEIQDNGGSEVRDACKKIKADKNGERCPTAEARITKAGKLSQAAIIHTVGPNCRKIAKPGHKENQELWDTYHKSLKLTDAYLKYVKNPNQTHDWYLKKVDSPKQKALEAKLAKGEPASIRLCCVSTGYYNYPAKKAANIMVRVIADYIEHHPTSDLKEFHIYCSKGQADLPFLRLELQKFASTHGAVVIPD